MGFNDFGLFQFGSFMKGDSPTTPDYLEYGSGSTLFTGSTNHLEDGFLRKAITYRWVGSNISGTSTLLTTEGNGSTIQEVGAGNGNSVGSNLYFRDLSAIGDKNNTFTTDVTFECKFSRPL